MPTLVLVRHGRTPANAQGVLAGRTPGVHLDEVGREQAEKVAARIAAVPLARLVASPLTRTVETAKAIAAHQDPTPTIVRDKGLVECGYGDWTGKPLKELSKDPLWKTVQSQPSAVTFPGGESLAGVQHRAVATVRRIDAEVAAEHGDGACWVAVSHGDVIKAILADALGMHLDSFQRLMVAPASVSVVQYTQSRPVVLFVNDGGADLSGLKPPARKRARKRSGDAAVGGGDGSL
ncbi:MSMEG_4193 family putative phosphomutase [Solicola sp. PLA-1-18]|uniref:MSMEG_4193 family putative phosphomutase n=1 Tax=Solicola sp. PLA-1-18 TaxID=3380532 RepID=UPI003B77C866